MKMLRPSLAKIILHAEGLGVPTADTVRDRAGEIARINGHREVTAADWVQAKRELHGGHPQASNDGDEMLASVSERDMTTTDPGHHVENLRDDSDTIVEELVAEGMDEAEHEQMLAAALRDRRENAGAD